MPTLHRTQILLERAQYEYLKSRAETEARSISDLLRELVTGDMNAAAVERTLDPLWALVGSVSGGEPHDTSDRVDAMVYGAGRDDATRTP